MTDKPVN